MQRITIDPITRLEGHGKIEIFLDEDGDVANTYFQIPELRGFEQFAWAGRSRRWRSSPTASAACARRRTTWPPPRRPTRSITWSRRAPGKMLRELLYSAFYCTDHTTHFYALGGPDFVMGPDAPVAERNILGVIHKVGLEIGGKVIQMRKYGHTVVEMIGGRKVHPCTSIPGGISHGITEEQREEIEGMGRWAIEFAQFSLGLFNDVVLGNEVYRDLILGDIYYHRTYSIGMVDENNKVNFYDGKVSVVDPDGKAHRQVRAGRVHRLDRRARRALDLSQVPVSQEDRLERLCRRRRFRRVHGHPALAAQCIRRHGDAAARRPSTKSSTRRVGQAGAPPPGHPLGAADRAALRGRALGGAGDRPGDHVDNFRTVPTATPTEGVGIVEAPRGTLTHHYWTDEPRGRDQSQPDRRHDEQLRADLDVDQQGGPVLHQARYGGHRRAAEPRRDGLPRVRSLLRLRHPRAPRPDAAGGDGAGRERRGGQGAAAVCGLATEQRSRETSAPPHLLSSLLRTPSSSASATRSWVTTGSAGEWWRRRRRRGDAMRMIDDRR